MSNKDVGFIGEGTLYIRRTDRPDLGFVEMGNATEFSVSAQAESKDRISHMYGSSGTNLNTVYLRRSGELRIVLDSCNAENLAMAFMGALEKKQMTSETVSDELVDVDIDRYLQLKHRYLQDTGIVVKKQNDDTITAEHYEIHHRLGMILIKATAGVAKGDKIKVSYKTADWNEWVINAQTDSSIKCELKLDGRNLVDNSDVLVEVHQATLSPDGAFNFLTEDFNTIEMSGRAELPAGAQSPYTVHAKA